MSDTKNLSPIFWVVGVIFLIWNAYGCFMYYTSHTMSDAAFAKGFGEASAAVRDLVPVWGVSTFAIAVWGGLIGAIMFLMRKKIAFPIFVVSLIAAVISFIPSFSVAELKEAAIADGNNLYAMPAMVCAMGLIEVIVSRMKVNKGILT